MHQACCCIWKKKRRREEEARDSPCSTMCREHISFFQWRRGTGVSGCLGRDTKIKYSFRREELSVWHQRHTGGSDWQRAGWDYRASHIRSRAWSAASSLCRRRVAYHVRRLLLEEAAVLVLVLLHGPLWDATLMEEGQRRNLCPVDRISAGCGFLRERYLGEKSEVDQRLGGKAPCIRRGAREGPQIGVRKVQLRCGRSSPCSSVSGRLECEVGSWHLCKVPWRSEDFVRVYQGTDEQTKEDVPAKEAFRVDAKAEGEDRRSYCGGGLGGFRELSRWEGKMVFHRIESKERATGVHKGEPFRNISSLELVAVLVAVILFGDKIEGKSTKKILNMTASTDNLGNTYVLKHLMSCKYPLSIVVTEVALQLKAINLELARMDSKGSEHRSRCSDEQRARGVRSSEKDCEKFRRYWVDGAWQAHEESRWARWGDEVC